MVEGLLLAIRIKGSVGLDEDRRRTLDFLRLRRHFQAVLLPDNPSIRGMLRKVERYVTWGTPNKTTLKTFLKKAGVERDTLEKLGFSDVEKLAEALERDAGLLKTLQLGSVRFHPPRGGFKRSIKRAFRSGVEYGVRDEAINSLAKLVA
jgi:large subunit ribosomal protein L30